MLHARTAAALASLFVALPAVAAPRRIVEDFEDVQPGDPPTAGWSWGGSTNLATQGGDTFLSGLVDTCCLTLSTLPGGGSRWVGDRDWRRFQVLGLRVTVGGTADFTTVRPVNLMLVDDSGTPADASDDLGYFYDSGHEYDFDGAQQTYSFLVPSQHTGSTPPGWLRLELGPDSPANRDWDDMITSVDQIAFPFWHPDYFYIFQYHTMGADDITIAYDDGS